MIINRKKINRIISLIIPIFFLFLLLVVVLSTSKTYAEIMYKLLSDENGITWQYGYDPSTSTLEVSFFETETDLTDITIPTSSFFINNDPSITAVENYVFTNYVDKELGTPKAFSSFISKIDLTNIDIVNGLFPLLNKTLETEIILNPSKSKIGYDVFRDSKINVTNLNKVTDIAGGTFYNTIFTDTNIELPNLNSLGDGSFENSNITTLKINAYVIGVSAFKNCKNLSSVELLDNVVRLNDSAFEGDTSLSEFEYNSVTSIGNRVFKDCTSYNIDIKDTKIEYIGTEVYSGTTGFNKSITIPDGVTYIPWKAFYGSNIIEVNLNNVQFVGPEAFENCKNLSKVNFGAVEEIKFKAFAGNTSMESVNLSDSVYYIQTQAFADCNINDLNLNKVQKIDFAAFANNQITNLYLPKSISVMEEPSVWYNNPLNKITIAYDTLSSRIKPLWVMLAGFGEYWNGYPKEVETLKTIELIAPYESNEEASIVSIFDVSRDYQLPSFNEGIYYIGMAAFNKELSEVEKYKNILQVGYLNNLGTIDNLILGEGYEFLGACQFSFWSITNQYYKIGAPKNIILPNTLKGIGISAFSSIYSRSYLDFSLNINLPNSLEYLGANAFAFDDAFNNNIKLPNLKYIGRGAFLYSGITGITFGNKLEFIGHTPAMMYARNEVLKELIIDCDFFNIYEDGDRPLALSSIFYATSSPKYDLVKFTGNVHDFNIIGDLFMYLDAKVLDIEEADLSSLGERAFLYSKIEELKLPRKLKKIDFGGFMYANVDVVDLSNTQVEEIGSLAFLSSTIRRIILSNNLKKIDSLAFYHYGLSLDQKINLPDTIEEIGDKAFLGFKNLPSTISLPNLKTIGEYAFYSTDVENIELTDNIISIGNNAFNGIETLKNIKIDCDFYRIAQFEDTLYYKDFGQNFTNYFYDNEFDTIEFTSKAVTPPVTNYGAFAGLRAKKLNIENTGITKIDNLMFRDAKIETLLLPKNTITEIGNDAFFKAEITNPIVLSDSITSIGEEAFQGANLTISNNLPNNLKTIGRSAFYDSIINDNIVVPSSVMIIGPSAFQSHTGSTIYSPTNGDIHRSSITFENPLSLTNTSGQTISQLLWHSSFDEIIFGDSVTELPTKTINEEKTVDISTPEFWDTKVEKVTFKNLVELPTKAFIHNTYLKEVVFNEDPNLDKINSHAFFGTSNLEKVDLYYGSELSLGSHAFNGSGLTTLKDEHSSLDIKNNKITLDGEFTFSYMPKLKDIDVTSSLNEGVIPKGTFYSDPLLEKVILEDDIKELKREAFGNNGGLKTFVMFGDTLIADSEDHKEIKYEDVKSVTFNLITESNFEIKIVDSDNFETIINKDTFGSETTYVYTVDEDKTIAKIETNDNVFLDYEIDSSNIVSIKDFTNEVMPIDTHANLYCYLINPYCYDYAQRYKALKEENNSDLYYLDEVLYLGANKNIIKLNDDKTEPITDDLILYALRRDGILMVSEEYGKMTDNVKYVDSGITIKDYDASTTNPKKMIFNTSLDPRYIDTKSNDNFENIEFVIGEEDQDTGRANVDFVYTNKVTSLQVDTILKTKGNYVDIVYADGCGGESFSNYVYEDIPKGDETPLFTGAVPEREGYRFIGWDKDISPTANEDVIYTAVWEKIVEEHPEIDKDIKDHSNEYDIPDTLKNKNISYVLVLMLILLSGIGIAYNYNKRKIKYH